MTAVRANIQTSDTARQRFLEGVVALRRPSFALQDDLGVGHTIHRPDLVSGRAWVELELHFGR